MWRCLNCETLNEGEKCMICGESKPTPEQLEAIRREELRMNAEKLDDTPRLTPRPYAPAAAKAQPAVDRPVFKDDGVMPEPPRKSIWPMVLVAVLVVVIIVASGIGIYLATMPAGGSPMALLDPDKAKYNDAVSMMESGEYEDAKGAFEELGSYGDASNMVLECDYRLAGEYTEDGMYVEAYDLYESLDGYSDSYNKTEELKEIMYDSAVSCYSEGDYDEAETYFEYTSGIENTDDYLTLIDAHNGDLWDVSALYDIIDFEDAKDVIMEEYSFEFLTGTWKSNSGYVLEFKMDGASRHCSHNLQAPSGNSWKIEDGIQYIGDSDSSSWSKGWKFTIIDEDTISVYCYNAADTYTMYRQ